MKTHLVALSAGAILSGAAPLPAAQSGSADTCANLSEVRLSAGKITEVSTVPAGQFVPPGATGNAARGFTVPAFCRVAAVLQPTGNSQIRMEAWLPKAGWNGKFLAVGNGGWAGSISYGGLAQGLNSGYAVVSTDGGHIGGNGSFSTDSDKLKDWGWRAVHELAVNGKLFTAAYYGAAPRYSYFEGCSGGGRQAVMAAQRFPGDFDGIVAGAPGIDWVRIGALHVQALKANTSAGERPVLSPAQITLVNSAVMAQCDRLDGLEDGEISRPRQCRPDLEALRCAPGKAPESCLGDAQIRLVQSVYGGVKDGGKVLYPGFTPGSEAGWAGFITQPQEVSLDTFRYLAGKGAGWDYRTFNAPADIATAERTEAGDVAATNADLSAFQKAGGKIILYHGWSDPTIAAERTAQYYDAVAAAAGSMDKAREFSRLFMVPNMGHCNGGYAASWLTALEGWVEHRNAPEFIVAQRLAPAAPAAGAGGPPAAPAVIGRRPLCAYPAVATYRGSGDINDPSSFACAAAP
ncbi:MAG: tannase/feruloyl esterase family alpha/beta hydrolase [Steroidobacteraceae bacterium]